MPSVHAELPSTAAGPSVPPDPRALRWRLALVLFVATVASIFLAGAMEVSERTGEPLRLLNGAPFALPLLAILVSHELGHFVFARIHRVNASLPMFIPLPLLSMFGTMGAVILMRDRIRSRNALVDIGASGPIAGMVVAIPILLFGLSHSLVQPIPLHGQEEGQCLLYSAAKWIALGRIPAGYDVFLSPTATAGWVGLFITMLNLFPIGQLDGGHVAYALFGAKQDRFGNWVRWLLLAMCLVNLVLYLAPALHDGTWHDAWATARSASLPWLVWFVVLTLLQRLGGSEHPPTDPSELSTGRKIVAIASLVLLTLLFMPAPMVDY